MNLGGGRGFSTADQSMAASGVTGSISSGFTGPSGGGGNGDSNDPYLGFVEASKPRGLSAIDRAVQNTVQKTKDFLSNPVNKRGILGGLLGGVLFGPLGALVGGSLGQRYGGTVSSFFQGRTPNTANTEIDMLTRSGMLQNQFLMPTKPPGITGIDIPNFDPDMELYAKVVGPALTQMRTLEKAKEMERFGGKPLTEGEKRALDKLKQMDADPNKIYSLPISTVT